MVWVDYLEDIRSRFSACACNNENDQGFRKEQPTKPEQDWGFQKAMLVVLFYGVPHKSHFHLFSNQHFNANHSYLTSFALS